jgi:tetratricopeptide (TPR) repeat protein
MLKAIYFGVLTYYVIALLLQRFIPLNHKKGIKFVKKGDFASAIEQHQQSYEFFTKHKKLDKYRFITMLSTSRISYTEMSLFNIAYCYAQSGNGALSKQYYEKVLAQFPNSGMAKSALNSIKAFEAKPDNPDE